MIKLIEASQFHYQRLQKLNYLQGQRLMLHKLGQLRKISLRKCM